MDNNLYQNVFLGIGDLIKHNKPQTIRYSRAECSKRSNIAENYPKVISSSLRR